jgi:hypothetical protein
LALAGLLPGKSVSRGRAFRQHIHVLAKRHRHPCRCPLRGLSSPTHRRTGARGKAAGHPGPHSSEERAPRAFPHLRTPRHACEGRHRTSCKLRKAATSFMDW